MNLVSKERGRALGASAGPVWPGCLARQPCWQAVLTHTTEVSCLTHHGRSPHWFLKVKRGHLLLKGRVFTPGTQLRSPCEPQTTTVDRERLCRRPSAWLLWSPVMLCPVLCLFLWARKAPRPRLSSRKSSPEPIPHCLCLPVGNAVRNAGMSFFTCKKRNWPCRVQRGQRGLGGGRVCLSEKAALGVALEPVRAVASWMV